MTGALLALQCQQIVRCVSQLPAEVRLRPTTLFEGLCSRLLM